MKNKVTEYLTVALLGMILLASCGGVTYKTKTELKRTESYTDFQNAKTVGLLVQIENDTAISNEKRLKINLGKKVRYDVLQKDILVEKKIKETDPDAFLSVLGVATAPIAIVLGDGEDHLESVGKDINGSSEVVSSEEKEANIRQTGRYEEKTIDSIQSGTLNVYINSSLARSFQINNENSFNIELKDLFKDIKSASSPFDVTASLSADGIQQETGKKKLKVAIGNAAYEGPLSYGEPHGKGRLTWPDGKVYAGLFTNGKMAGSNAPESGWTEPTQSKKHIETARFEKSTTALTVSGKSQSPPRVYDDGVKHARLEIRQEVSKGTFPTEYSAGIRKYYYRVSNPNDFKVKVKFNPLAGDCFAYKVIDMSNNVSVYTPSVVQPGNQELANISPLRLGYYNWQKPGGNEGSNYCKNEQPTQFIMPKNASFAVMIYKQDSAPFDKERLPNGQIKYRDEDYRLYYGPAKGLIETRPFESTPALAEKEDTQIDLHKGYWGVNFRDRTCGKYNRYLDLSFNEDGKVIMYCRCYDRNYPNHFNGVFNDDFIYYDFKRDGDDVYIERKRHKFKLAVTPDGLVAAAKGMYADMEEEITFINSDKPQTPYGWAESEKFSSK